MKPGLALARDAGDGVDVAVRAGDAAVAAFIPLPALLRGPPRKCQESLPLEGGVFLILLLG
jgi:hypothetical protein